MCIRDRSMLPPDLRGAYDEVLTIPDPEVRALVKAADKLSAYPVSYTHLQEIKELIYELNGRYPGLKSRAFGAMQRLPLPAWGPVEHRRRPLSEEPEDFQ